MPELTKKEGATEGYKIKKKKTIFCRRRHVWSGVLAGASLSERDGGLSYTILKVFYYSSISSSIAPAPKVQIQDLVQEGGSQNSSHIKAKYLQGLTLITSQKVVNLLPYFLLNFFFLQLFSYTTTT